MCRAWTQRPWASRSSGTCCRLAANAQPATEPKSVAGDEDGDQAVPHGTVVAMTTATARSMWRPELGRRPCRPGCSSERVGGGTRPPPTSTVVYLAAELLLPALRELLTVRRG